VSGGSDEEGNSASLQNRTPVVHPVDNHFTVSDIMGHRIFRQPPDRDLNPEPPPFEVRLLMTAQRRQPLFFAKFYELNLCYFTRLSIALLNILHPARTSILPRPLIF
jgi:hypothetical protein